MERVNRKKKKRVRRSFVMCVVLFCLIGTALAFYGYLKSDFSNVQSIVIHNPTFLSDDYIMEALNLNTDSKYVLVIPYVIENRNRGNLLLEGIEIHKEKNHSIVIDVSSNPIVAYCSNDANSENPIDLVLQDGSKMPFNNQVIKTLSSLPLIYGMDETLMKQVALELAQVNCDVLARISEISCVPFTYESSMLKCVMDDGYDIYIPHNQLQDMNHYFNMIRDINKESGAILYFEGVFLNLSDEEIYKKMVKPEGD